MCSNNKTQISPHDPTKLAINSILRPEDDFISNCGRNFNKTVSFDDIVHLIEEEYIVTYEVFDCDFTFNPGTPTKIKLINRERNYISSSCENSISFPVTFGITVSLMRSITLISFWTRTIYETWFQQIFCQSITLMIDTLSPISTLNQQFTSLEQSHIRRSLHCEGWTVKGRDCASALHSFNEITYQTGEWTKELLRLKSWVISGNPERRMDFRRLWWMVIVFKCSHLFHFLISIVCLCNILFLFLFLLVTWSEK